MRNGLTDGHHVGVGSQLVELLDDRFNRQGHVCAGVTVGHGVDIEAVNYLFVGSQQVGKGADYSAEVSGRQCRWIGH